MAQLSSLQQQSEWLLEEQGEFPEGQDHIWQLHDSVIDYSKQLPKLVNRVLRIKDKYDEVKPRFEFNVNSKYNNKESKLSGAIYSTVFEPNRDISDTSLLSIIQAHAQVVLGDELFAFLSARLPIYKLNFKLIYKQNKFLMQ